MGERHVGTFRDQNAFGNDFRSFPLQPQTFVAYRPSLDRSAWQIACGISASHPRFSGDTGWRYAEAQ
jgi:hypothetical protein